MIGRLAAALFLLATMLPTAQAHVTVTAAAPSGPLVPGTETKIDVTVSANCAVVLAEYQAMGKTELELELQAPAPSWLTGKGDKIPFKVDMCGSDGNVKSTGKLGLTPSLLAPGLQPVNISVGAKGEAGTANVLITVAYRAAIESAPQSLEVALVDGNASGVLAFNASINADSIAMIDLAAEPTGGTLDLPSTLDIATPIAQNRTSALVTIPFTYRAIGPGGSEEIRVRLMLHAAADMNQASDVTEILLRIAGSTTPATNATKPPAEKGFLPAPDLGILLLLVAAAVVTRRRRP